MEEKLENTVAWGAPINGVVCGLSFAHKNYTVGDEIAAEFWVKNISEGGVKIVKPRRMRDWNFQIAGPVGGDYAWKGPAFKWKPIEAIDFIELASGGIEKCEGSLGGQIEQKVLDWNSVLPGKYEIKIGCANLFFPQTQEMETGIFEIEII